MEPDYAAVMRRAWDGFWKVRERGAAPGRSALTASREKPKVKGTDPAKGGAPVKRSRPKSRTENCGFHRES